MEKRSFPRPVTFVTLLVALGLMASALTVSAQNAAGTPESGSAVGAEIQLRPAHIHSGTCAELGDVVYPLNDLQAAQHVASPEASPSSMTDVMAMASPGATEDIVAQSGTAVDASLDDILAEEHAINVHESAENISNYIACGDITGTPTDGELTIELQELNESGYVGEAVLTDNGDGTTFVHVSLFPVDAVEEGTPEATPTT